MELGTSKLAISYEIGCFQTGKITWDLALPRREFQMFIWNWELPRREWNLALPIRESQMFIWNCELPSTWIHMKFGTSKQRNSYEFWQFEMKLCTSKQGISYEIWHFQTWKFNWNLALPIREIHMKFVISNQGTSIVRIKLGTSNQGNSYEI